MKCVVITSINPPNARLSEFVELGYEVIVVGDTKTDEDLWQNLPEGILYLGIQQQEEFAPELSQAIGWKTYARKNIGYLYALARGAQTIWETDDDTFARSEVGDPLSFLGAKAQSQLVSGTTASVWNPYSEFAPASGLWPRGMPLALIRASSQATIQTDSTESWDVLQTLVNLEPDVDAIFRLTVSDSIFDFPPTRNLFTLGRNVVSPGNTQSTFWKRDHAARFTYFPSTVSNRFADILKMYVAQTNLRVAYAGFLTEQIRNAHDYMMDFREETDMYLKLDVLVDYILNVEHASGLSEIYRELAHLGICLPRESQIVEAFEKKFDEITNC